MVLVVKVVSGVLAPLTWVVEVSDLMGDAGILEVTSFLIVKVEQRGWYTVVAMKTNLVVVLFRLSDDDTWWLWV